MLKRQIALLEQQDQPVSVGKISQGSVAVKGLPALEFLLFRENALSLLETGQTCSLLVSISYYLNQTAKELFDAWQGVYGNSFSGKDTSYDVATDHVDDYINGLATALQQIQRRKLGDPLGIPGGRTRVSDLESHLSQSSLENIRVNISAIGGYFRGKPTSTAEGYGVADLLSDIAAEDELARAFEDQLLQVERSVLQLNKPLEIAGDDQVFMAKAEDLHQQLGDLYSLLQTKVFKALGITRDFNSEDGD